VADPDKLIDTLSIALKLDTSQYKAGEEQVNQSFGKTKAKGKRTAESLEASGKQGAEFFNQLADRAIRLGTVLLGGVGVKDLLANTVKTNAAMGYAARNIGVTTNELATMQGVVRQMGGDAGQVAPALQGLSNALATIQRHGEGSEGLIEAFGYLGISGEKLIDPLTGRIKDLVQLMPDLRKGLLAFSEKFGQPQAFSLGEQLGLTPDLLNALTLAGDGYERLYADSAAVTKASEAQAKQMQELVTTWGLYETAVAGAATDATTMAIDGFKEIGKAADEAGKAIDKLPQTAKTAGSLVKTALLGPIGWLLGKEDKKYIGSDTGAVAGGLTGAALGSLVPIPILGTLIGAIIGVVGGGILGAAGQRTYERKNPSKPGVPEAPVPVTLVSPKSQPAHMSSPIDWTPAGMLKALGAGAGSDRAAAAYGIIRGLEGGKEASATPTRDPKDPFAYGLNQITLGTARGIDPTATPEKLMKAEYNDRIAKALQAKSLAKYGDNFDAVAIAYHNGEAAADRFVASGGDTAATGNWGPESQKYLTDARAAATAAGVTNNSSATHIGSISVNAPRATDADGIVAGMRERLENDQLISDAQSGGQ
jgi:hypothetical protein